MSNKKREAMPIRFIVSALIILAEFIIIIWGTISLSERLLWIYTVSSIISAITVIYIVNSHGLQTYKILWTVFILAVPVFGLLAYTLWGGGRIAPYIKKRMRGCQEEYKAMLKEDDKVCQALKYNDPFHFRQAQYLINESGYPLYRNTSTRFFSPGEKLMPTLLEELKKAEKYIYLEFFIIADGQMWESVFSILKQKAAAGVEIKVIFDDFGSAKYQNKGFTERLKKSGIKVAIFNPISPSINIFMNNRNHRKIIVIDGKTAFTGGMNIADEYINLYEKHGYWMDCTVMLKGEAVDSFLNMFCSMWKFTTGEAIDYLSHKGNFSAPSSGFCIPYCDDPLNNNKPAEGIYLQILGNAQKYVYIATPYLILESNALGALCRAAKTGVDIRIVTPHIPDKWYVHPATQFYYEELLEAGVKIYEYTPGFIHSKLFLSDDIIATAGTINIDYRSLYLHFECGVWMSGTESIGEIKENFSQIFSDSQQIELSVWNKRPWYLKLKQFVLHLFAPFM